MKPLARPEITLITDVLDPEQARAFLDLVLVIKQRPDHESLEIRDEEGEVLGCLILPECHASADDPPTDPKFLKELERRAQSSEPVIMIDEDGIDLDDLLYDDEEPE
jgi:hypothetical protein